VRNLSEKRKFSDEEVSAIISRLHEKYFTLDDRDIESFREGYKYWSLFCQQRIKENNFVWDFPLDSRFKIVSDIAQTFRDTAFAKYLFRNRLNTMIEAKFLPVVVSDMDETIIAAHVCPESVMEEISGILKAGGIFIIVTGSGKGKVDKYLLKPYLDFLKRKGIDENILSNFLILPCNGAQMFVYNPVSRDFDLVYQYSLEEEIGSESMEKLIGKTDDQTNSGRYCILTEALKKFGLQIRPENDQIDNRYSQITFCPLGSKATEEQRSAFADRDQTKRRPWVDYIMKRCKEEKIPVEVSPGGLTSIDIISSGINKGFAIDNLCGLLGINPEQIVFFGDKRKRPPGNGESRDNCECWQGCFKKILSAGKIIY
jgi:hydroxymethylpyrimidine pyrophosphatase-like HAD family hydrolase